MMKRLGISRETVQSMNDALQSRPAAVNGTYALPPHNIQPVLPASNQAVIRSGHETRLYQDICEAITDPGGYRLAWIGFAEDDLEKSVRIVARSGPSTEYVNALEITWGADVLGQGPAGTCIRSGKVRIVNDLEQDPRFLPWRKRAAQYRCRSSVALPLRCCGKIIGVLSVYAAESHAFQPEEMSVFQEFADGLLSTTVQDIDMRDCARMMSGRLAAIRERGKASLESVQVRENAFKIPVELHCGAIDCGHTLPRLDATLEISEPRMAKTETRAPMAEMERAEVESANGANSRFLASMSDEIRISMDSITGMTNLLLKTPLEPGQRDLADTLCHSVQELLAMVNEIVNFSKIETT
jgi:putative methionine-R-sulfoxide reductase with GAF domain